MMLLEAFNQVEHALTALELKDRWGDSIIGISASGIVAKHIGEGWDMAVDAFEAGKITPDEYCTMMLYLIGQFERDKFHRLIEKKISELGLDQIELELLGAS